MYLILKIAAPIFLLTLALTSVSTTKGDFSCTEFDCDYAIEIGSTPYEDALRMLQIRYGRSNVLTRFHTHGPLWIDFEGDNPLHSGTAYIDENGVVGYMRVYFPNVNYRVSDLVDRFGEPSHVFMEDAYYMCYGRSIYFREAGFRAWIIRRDDAIVHPNQPISTIEICSSFCSPEYHDTVTLWQGYTDYCRFRRSPAKEGSPATWED